MQKKPLVLFMLTMGSTCATKLPTMDKSSQSLKDFAVLNSNLRQLQDIPVAPEVDVPLPDKPDETIAANTETNSKLVSDMQFLSNMVV